MSIDERKFYSIKQRQCEFYVPGILGCSRLKFGIAVFCWFSSFRLKCYTVRYQIPTLSSQYSRDILCRLNRLNVADYSIFAFDLMKNAFDNTTSE